MAEEGRKSEMSYCDTPVQCQNNEGVSCKNPDNCGKCGWNDEVAAARAIQILAGMGIRVEMK